MCGICGIVHFDSDPVSVDPLRSSCSRMRHRGPNQSHQWVERSIGLGAVRLAVLDPSQDASQPMHDSSGRFHLVFNGEVYNFESIRRELGSLGHSFRTCGDTEVVLLACQQWGVEALTRFNGMWSLAFYDSSSESGFLSRDRFGIKPLLYGTFDKDLRFASELDAFRSLGDFDRSIDKAAVGQLLCFGYIPQPRSIYQHVRRLAPGHVLEFNADGIKEISRYFDPCRAIVDTPSSYIEAQILLRRTLADAVTARRVSDVPIGAFLSGGTDSTILAYHLQQSAGRTIDTFSIGFPSHAGYDESSHARSAAAILGTRHHELLLNESDVLDAIPKILDHLSEPFGDSSIIPTSLLSAFARQHVTVVLSGDGADELFAGYWRHAAHDSWQAYQRIPGWLRSNIIEPVVDKFATSKSSVFGNRVRQFRKLVRSCASNPLDRHIAWSQIVSEHAYEIMGDDCDVVGVQKSMCELAIASSEGYAANDSMNRILAYDLQYGLPADMLHKVDTASMMHSLEARVPFLDHNVVNVAMSMPSSWKIDRGQRKRVLVDAYRGIVPDNALDRPKQGFELPIGEMLRGPLIGLFRDIVDRNTVEADNILSYDGVSRILDDHCARRAENADILFAILSLCWWRRKG